MKEYAYVGVVVGRFQTPYLHEGHRYLLDTAQRHSDVLLIAVGVSGGQPSARDPLDFETRRVMLRAAYPDAIIVPVYDHPSNLAWSRALDELIMRHMPDHQAILFGSRDSFLLAYQGTHKRRELEAFGASQATRLRAQSAQMALDMPEFRAGVIYAHSTQYFPTSFQTVDIGIRHHSEEKVLLGRKKGSDKWCFPGGFVDPIDSTLEGAIYREAREELGDIEISNVSYLTSLRVQDYRYRGSQHQIMTALFTGIYASGLPEARDDLEELRWQDLSGLLDCLTRTHRPLGEIYLAHI